MTTSTSGLSAVERLLRRVDLAVADAVEVVEDLALQVRGVDLVHVDDADRADAGRGEVQRGRRAEAAGAEQEHLGVEQLGLALDADLGQQEVALVAVASGPGSSVTGVFHGRPSSFHRPKPPAIDTTSV